MNPVLVVGIFMIVGLFGGFVARKIKFPTISGYIITGIGLSLLNVIPRELINGELNVITDVSLGIIGYLVGGGLKLKRLKKLGRVILSITPFEAIGAWIFVTALIALLGPLIIRFSFPNPNFYQSYLPMALVLGAISCATAPAATVAIIHEYRASGPFTTTLLAIVALDDAVAVIAYAIGSSIAETLIAGFKSIPWHRILMPPTINIFGSILLGIALGFGLIYITRFAKTRRKLLVMVLGMILLCVGAAKALDVSNILANMALGFIIANKMKSSENMFGVINDIEDIIFAVFFTLAGLHFDLGVIKMAGILAVLLFVGRCSGKFAGAYLGASISHSPLAVRKYLGFGLLPIAGVTVGLAMLVKQHSAFSGIESIMINGILASVIINELVAPPLTKYAIFKAGEAFNESRHQT